MTSFNLPTDKVAHFGTCVAWTHLMSALAFNLWESAICIGIISVAKEFIDIKTGGKWDWNDIYANYAGWAFYMIVLLLVA